MTKIAPDVTRLVVKAIVLTMPFLVLVAVEMFVLPIDYFTFRPWEAFLVRNVWPADGPFYPNMHLVKSEGRDGLGFSDPQPRRTEWFTDRFGFRNRPEVADNVKFDIVVLGDSNIVGSSLDQKETAAEVLAFKCRCKTYSYGSAGKRQFLSDPRFKASPPRAVVAEARTGELYVKKVADLYYGSDVLAPEPSRASGLPTWVAVLADRLTKQNMLEYTKSRLHIPLHANADTSEGVIPRAERTAYAVSMITKMHNELQRRGTDFVFYMMPGPDRSLDEALMSLESHGVKTVAFFPTPGLPHGVDLDAYYQQHDSHWRPETVRYFADDVLAKLGWRNYAPEPSSPNYVRP